MGMALKCDRCGKLFECSKESHKYAAIKPLVAGDYTKLDLCPECYKLFEYFINDSETKPFIIFDEKGINIYPFENDKIIFDSHLGFCEGDK